jgi:hypothetical protein
LKWGSKPVTEQWNEPAGWGWRDLLAGLLFFCVAIWLTWPQVAVLGAAIVGGPIAESDGWQNVWNFWWVRSALLHGENPLYTRLLFWPDGVPLGLHTLTITSALLSLPVLLVGGPVAAYGVVALLNFTLSGLLTMRLARSLLGSWPAALASGLIVEVAPVHLARFMDGQHHTSLQWIALYLIALILATRAPTIRNGVWLALSIALVTYTSWYQALFLALLTATWLVYHIVAARQIWPLARPWLAAAPVLVLLLLPVVPGLVAGVSGADRPAEHWQTQAQFYSVDLVDLLLPSANHPIWGPAVTAYQQPLHPNSIGWMIAPGYVALALAAIGLALDWRRARLWGLLVGVLLLFSLGPTLRVHGADTGVPLPFTIIGALPGANFGRRPSLATIVALVPLALLAGFGVRALGQRLRGRWRVAVFGALLALGLFEAAPPRLLVLRDDTPPIYASLRDGAGALLELPVYPPPGLANKSAALRAQMTHGRPIAGGYVARPPDYPLAQGAPLIGQLGRAGCEPAGIVPDDAVIERSALAYYGFTQIAVRRDLLSNRELACARRLLEGTLGLKPSRSSGAVAIYDLPPAALQPFIFLGDDWLPLEHDGARAWRWMGGEGKLYLVNTDRQPRTFVIRLRAASFDHPRVVESGLDERSLGTATIGVAPARTYTLLARVDPGQHLLWLRAPADRDPRVERDISILVESATIEVLP